MADPPSTPDDRSGSDDPVGDEAGTPRAKPPGRHRRLDNRTIAICVCIALVAALAAALVATFVADDSSSANGSVTDSGPVGLVDLKPVDPNAPATPPGDPIEGLVGDSFRLTDFAGTPTIVNFFSTTCAPCVKEMPGFEQLHQQLGDQVTFVGIDVTDTKAAGRGLVARTGVTYRTGFDPQGNVLRDLNGRGLPTTVVIDRQGQIVEARTGALQPDELRAILDSHQLLGALVAPGSAATAPAPTSAP